MSHHDDNQNFDPTSHRWGYEINSALLAVIGIAGTLLVYVIIIAVQATYIQTQEEANAALNYVQPRVKLVEHHNKQVEIIKDIDKGMDKVVATYNK